ncbi:monovalent cation/H+ antiporter complex subunit F [Ahrensia sp. R2A130]|uniref:monovalent cation/H+ antiporter complex subunit F n=1 Tax=Ahrensia sp. R2A130 TaxID=744979 RepID=UPI0001E0E0D1|nr:monovalent cation/H+ antiporter complex subunit F [Ahrensia sp. R2A130]EFL88937.1 multiple resistance and pH regulation protein F [Ahrensia sp. R2A130]
MMIFVNLLIILCMVMMLIRLFVGPTLYDRVLALNVFGTATVLLIAAMGFLAERPEFLDIALLYALINFVGTIAVLKFFRYRRLGDAPEDSEMVGTNSGDGDA